MWFQIRGNNNQQFFPIHRFPNFRLIFQKNNSLNYRNWISWTIRFLSEDKRKKKYGPVEYIHIQGKSHALYLLPLWQFYTWNDSRHPSKDVWILVSKVERILLFRSFFLFFFYQNSYRWRKFPKGGRGEENFRLHGKQSKSRGERSKRRKGKEGAKNRGEVNNLLRGRGWNLRLLSRLKFIGEGEVTEPWMRNCNIDRRCAWKLN